MGKLHREQAVIERIFQALPTQINTVALIYKIHKVRKGWHPNPMFGSHGGLDFNIKSGKDGTWGIRFQETGKRSTRGF